MTTAKKVRLDWPHRVETGLGVEQSAYGLPLQYDEENHIWFALMSPARAKSESSRKHKPFLPQIEK